MEELTLRQMQEGALNILKKLDGICREQGLRYFLFYGTLIGAIRHKGFIPWDDDLDVAMPRPDFDRLVAYCRQHRQELLPMRLMTVDDNPQYVYPIARFSDTRYRVKYQGIRDYGLGLFVDVYPLDGCGNTEEEARAWVQQPMRDVKFINCCAAEKFTPSRRGWLHTPPSWRALPGPGSTEAPITSTASRPGPGRRTMKTAGMWAAPCGIPTGTSCTRGRTWKKRCTSPLRTGSSPFPPDMTGCCAIPMAIT